MASLTVQKLGVLTKRAEFLHVREGRYAARGAVVVQMRRPEVTTVCPIRYGVTATKKVGNAVVRNRAKRRLREAARALLPIMGQPGFDYVLIARRKTHIRDWSDLLDDVRRALQSVHEPSPRPSS